MMVRQLLGRGMLIGVLAGLLGFCFAWAFGEPQVDLAIAFEDHMHRVAGEAPDPEIVSRAVQSSFGLLTGILVYAAALGGIFALAFSYAHGRLGRMTPRTTAALLAAAAFLVIVLVPQLKYPANPPSIGNPETIGVRTELYFGMLVLSIGAAVAALGTGRLLVNRLGAWHAGLAGVGAYLLAMIVVMLVLRPVDEVPARFSAVVLWRFRTASLGIELVVWSTLGVVFGEVAERLLGERGRHPRPAS